MKQQIKHRDTDAVLFECELPDGTEYPMRDALVKSVASSADLRFADLSSANLRFGKLIGDRPYFSIGGIGSRQDYLTLWMTDAGNVFKTGCFTGLLDEFEASIKKTHGENNHAKEYAAAIAMCKAHIEIWTPKE